MLPRCDPYTNWLLTGDNMNVCCHSNLTRAVAGHGLGEEDVHDVLNVFMCTGFTRDTNQYFTKPSPVRSQGGGAIAEGCGQGHDSGRG